MYCIIYTVYIIILLITLLLYCNMNITHYCCCCCCCCCIFIQAIWWKRLRTIGSIPCLRFSFNRLTAILHILYNILFIYIERVCVETLLLLSHQYFWVYITLFYQPLTLYINLILPPPLSVSHCRTCTASVRSKPLSTAPGPCAPPRSSTAPAISPGTLRWSTGLPTERVPWLRTPYSRGSIIKVLVVLEWYNIYMDL